MLKTRSEEKFRDIATEILSLKEDSSKFFFFRKQMKARSGVTFMEPLFTGYVFMETHHFERIVDGPLLGFRGKSIRVNKRCQRVTVEIQMLEGNKKIDLCYQNVITI